VRYSNSYGMGAEMRGVRAIGIETPFLAMIAHAHMARQTHSPGEGLGNNVLISLKHAVRYEFMIQLEIAVINIRAHVAAVNIVQFVRLHSIQIPPNTITQTK